MYVFQKRYILIQARPDPSHTYKDIHSYCRWEGTQGSARTHIKNNSHSSDIYLHQTWTKPKKRLGLDWLGGELDSRVTLFVHLCITTSSLSLLPPNS